jgi:hypothetical protein
MRDALSRFCEGTLPAFRHTGPDIRRPSRGGSTYDAGGFGPHARQLFRSYLVAGARRRQRAYAPHRDDVAAMLLRTVREPGCVQAYEAGRRRGRTFTRPAGAGPCAQRKVSAPRSPPRRFRPPTPPYVTGAQSACARVVPAPATPRRRLQTTLHLAAGRAKKCLVRVVPDLHRPPRFHPAFDPGLSDDSVVCGGRIRRERRSLGQRAKPAPTDRRIFNMPYLHRTLI